MLLWLLVALPYSGDQRISRLQAQIDVVQRTPREVLVQAYQYGAVYERSSCASPNQRLRVECLITAARNFCQKQPNPADCAAYQDVIVSNLLAEKQLVPTARRLEIMKQTADWRREMAREIRRIQASLAASLQLREPSGLDTTPGLAKAIDTFCVASAFETGLSWQICAASLVWFIGARGPDVGEVAK